MDSAGGVMLPEGPASDQHAVNSGILSTEANKLRRDCSSILECTSAANLHATANPHRVPLMRRLVQQDSRAQDMLQNHRILRWDSSRLQMQMPHTSLA